MNHVAVDLGSRQSQFCVRAVDGQVKQEGKVPTKQLGRVFQSWEKSRIVLESCAEAFVVADMALEAGHEVNVVPATLAPSLGVGQRGVKTDKKDAQNLSLASCRMEQLPRVHVPALASRERRALLTGRAALVGTRTMLINNVRGWMRTQLLRIASGKTSTFPTRAREAALERPAGLPMHIERLLKVIDSVNEQIAEADAEVKAIAKQDPVCQRLMTAPGVGPIVATGFQAALDKVERFSSAHTVAAYMGLTPGENSSGERTQRTGITKAGSVRVRSVLVQAAWIAYRTRPEDPMVKWARALAQRKPVQVAIVALARKLSGILFAMWRDEKNYDPAHHS